jgi:hypothetical protein
MKQIARRIQRLAAKPPFADAPGQVKDVLRRTRHGRRSWTALALLKRVAPDQRIKHVADIDIEEPGILLVRRDNRRLDILQDIEVLFLDSHDSSLMMLCVRQRCVASALAASHRAGSGVRRF